MGSEMCIRDRTWDMRDNWMDLADFSVGDETFEVTHGLLVDRLRFLPNNTVGGEQVILVRGISGDEASTNLAVGIYIMGDEKITQSDSDGSIMGIIVGILALLVLVLLVTLVFAGMQLRDRGFFDSDDLLEDEYGSIPLNDILVGGDEEVVPDGD